MRPWLRGRPCRMRREWTQGRRPTPCLVRLWKNSWRPTHRFWCHPTSSEWRWRRAFAMPHCHGWSMPLGRATEPRSLPMCRRERLVSYATALLWYVKVHANRSRDRIRKITRRNTDGRSVCRCKPNVRRCCRRLRRRSPHCRRSPRLRCRHGWRCNCWPRSR